MSKYILIFIFTLNTLFAWKMEADIITVKRTKSDTITHINFRQKYNTAPLVFTLPTTQGSNPATLRIVNVSTSGFDIYSIEPQGEDGPHARMTKVPYIAIEPGEHTLPDGTKITAGVLSTKKYQAKGDSASSWDSISLSGFSTTPVILTEIQTRNNERTDKSVPDAVSKPWLSVAVNNISSSGFNIALERSETTKGAITKDETIAYLAVDSSLKPYKHYFADNLQEKIEYETILTGNKITGYDDSTQSVSFSKSYTNPVAVAKKSSHNENDGGWFRRKNIANDSIDLVVDEDRAKDKERSHTAEKASILVFSQPFDADFYPSSNAKLIINEVLYKETKKGTNNDEFIEMYVKKGGNLKGFAISDQDCNYYIFTQECQVNAGDYVILHTGSGINNCSGSVKEFYQNKSQYFNNTKDDVLLIKPILDVTTTTNKSSCGTKTFNGEPADYIAYGSQGGTVDSIPTSLKGVTLNWNEKYVNELDNASSGVSISLTPNANDSDKAACWEFTASGNAKNNGCSNYLPTQDTNPNIAYKDSKGHSNNAMPSMSIKKSSIIISDPVNDTDKPKRIPGAIMRYCFKVDNTGEGNANNVKIKDTLSNNGKDNLQYVKSGSMIQNINNECNCQSSKMDENKGSINGNKVTIDIGTLTGTSTPATSRGCAFIEVKIK